MAKVKDNSDHAPFSICDRRERGEDSRSTDKQPFYCLQNAMFNECLAPWKGRTFAGIPCEEGA